ncbi:oxidoreductase [Burkholderia sp. THE68]|uniref:alpha/beta fold hydrolase n=1 Tax=Burkholderia sp. THE68 TaxID=758782 RepID=UPI0013161C40|nr:alpha/beta hydrolase [Burkholderia sp. THE68]BBU30326.1 oxidoreductase [Burkholderia sp. THE68]
MDHGLEGEVDIDGAHLHFSRSTLTPSIVLLHGIPTNRRLWRQVAPFLAAAGHGWIAFDLLGYGKSSKPEEMDLGVASQATIISAALRRLGWQSGTVVGHDIGGGVAQLLALDVSVGVRRIVLVDSVAYDSFPEPGIARLKGTAWDRILADPSFDLKKGFEKGLRQGMVNKNRVTPELVELFERPFAGVPGRLAYLRAARSLKSEDLTSRIGEIERITCPVLLVSGSEDQFQPVAFAERLAAALPDATLKVVPSAGHFLPEDAPEALARLIVDFLKEQNKSV